MSKSEAKKVIFSGTTEEVKNIPMDVVKQLRHGVQVEYFKRVDRNI